MAEWRLRRSDHDHKLYELLEIGELRTSPRWLSREVQARAVDGRAWTFDIHGFLHTKREAVDGSGQVVGSFAQRKKTWHGGSVTWYDTEYDVSLSSAWKNRYALSLRGDEILTVEAKGWGKEPVTISAPDEHALERADPGLVLFTTWLVQTFVEDDTAAVAGTIGVTS